MDSPGQASGRDAFRDEWERIKKLQAPADRPQVEAFIARLKARDIEKELAGQEAGGGGAVGEAKDAAWYQARMQEAQQKMAAAMQSGKPYTDPEVQGHVQEMQKHQQEYIRMVSDPSYGQAVAAKKKGSEEAVNREKRWTAMMLDNAGLKLARLAAGAGGDAGREEVFSDLDTSVPPGTPPGWWVRVPRWMVDAKDINDPEELPASMEEEPDGWVTVLLEVAPNASVPTETEYRAARSRDPVPTKYCEPRFVLKATFRNESRAPVRLGTLDYDWFSAYCVDDAWHAIHPWSGFDCKPEFDLLPPGGPVVLEPGASLVKYIGFVDLPLGARAFPPERLSQVYLSIRRRHTYLNEFRRTVAPPPPSGVQAPAKVVVELTAHEFREGKRWDTSLGKNVKYAFIPARQPVRTSLPQNDGPRTFLTDRDRFIPLRLGKARVRATAVDPGPVGLVAAGTVNACEITDVRQVTNPEPSFFEHEGPRRATGAGKPAEAWRLENLGHRPMAASGDLSVCAVGGERGFRVLDHEGYALAEVELGDAPKTLAVSGRGDMVVAGWRNRVAACDAEGRNLWTTELKKGIVSVKVSGDGGCVLATCRNDDLHLLTKDGKVAWSREVANADGPLAVNRSGDRALVKTTSSYLCLDGDAKTLWKFDQSYHGEYPASGAMSDDGGLVAIGTDKNMYILDGAGKERFKQYTDHVKACAVAGDGSLAAFSDWQGNTVVVDRDGKVVASLQTASGDRSVALARDGKGLLVMSGGGLARFDL